MLILLLNTLALVRLRVVELPMVDDLGLEGERVRSVVLSPLPFDLSSLLVVSEHHRDSALLR